METIADRVLFTQKNGDFGAISVTERSRAELESGASHVGWVLSHSLVQCEQVSNRCGSEQLGYHWYKLYFLCFGV